MSERPSGTVTFLFTDIVGSTRLWEEHGASMQRALARHDAILRDAVERHDGYVFKTTGDGTLAAFASATDAVNAAADSQRALATEPWPPDAVIAARMAVHTGVAEERDGDYFGPTLNRAARLMAIGHGGQILVSSATAAVLDDAAIELRDLGEHRLRDLSRPERVAQVVAEGLAGDHPPLRSLDALPTNLPVQLTSFVGRDQELARVTKAIRDHRLVTLTGVGGVGKTRLALQAAAELVAQFPDGVWITELAPAGDPETMGSVIATALSIQPRTGLTLEQSIVAALADRELLWVLDNCEHLIEATARLVDQVLRSAPAVRVMATSREALDVDGEHIVPLRSMALGDASHAASIGDSDAVRLFEERAAAVRPTFTVTDANARPIADLCRRLDGIPLAIELAAARMASIGVDELLGLLGERFRVLTGGRRVALERHQTLRATVDWSYSLLAEDERTVFDRLSVFAGSFDTRAARAVVGDDAVDEWQVLDALDGLVRKSMVSIDEQADGGLRYQLLETMRQYARERVEARGGIEELSRRHAEHYVARSVEIGDGLSSRDEIAWRERLLAELDNIRAACAFALDSGDTRSIVRVAAALDGERMAGTAPIPLIALRALELPTNDVTPDEMQELLAAAANEAYRSNEFDRVPDLIAAIAPLQPDMARWSARVIRVHTTPGMATEAQMRMVAAVATQWTTTPPMTERDPAEAARVDIQLALATVTLGDIATARRCAERALELSRRSGNPSTIAQAASQYGAAISTSEPDAARVAFAEAIDLGRRGVRFVGRGAALMQAALVDARAGRADVAASLLLEALAVMRPAGRSSELDGACGFAIDVLTTVGAVDAALVIIGSVMSGALAVLRTMPLPPSRTAPDVRAMRDAVGKERFAELLDRGARMTYDEILDHVAASLEHLV